METDNQIVVKPLATPAGQLLLGSFQNALCLCRWTDGCHAARTDLRLQRLLQASFATGSSPTIALAVKEIEEYFAHRRQAFDVPLHLAGSPFQQHVWQALRAIPFGETLSYSALARRIGQPTATRAVANAVAANPIAIFVPCHRVVGSNGSLTGFAGGLSAKRCLIENEWIR